MATASDVMVEAAAMCGDRNQVLYTNDKLLPLLKRANRDLSMALLADSITKVDEEHTSTVIAAVTGITHPNPPNDLAVPLTLWERPDSSTSDLDWRLMDQKQWDPSDPQETDLRVWRWRDDEIQFKGALEAKKVKMLYQKSLSPITSAGDGITVLGGEHFLAAKTASYAARFVGKNPTMGAELNGEAQQALALLLGIRVKEDQNEVLRMLPYSMNRR